MSWFVQSLTILWYAGDGQECPGVKRDRPWYKSKVTPTFSDMLGSLRLQHWEMLFSRELGSGEDRTEFLEFLKTGLLRFTDLRNSSQSGDTCGPCTSCITYTQVAIHLGGASGGQSFLGYTTQNTNDKYQPQALTANGATYYYLSDCPISGRQATV